MKHSFIAPRSKKIVSTELKLVLFFFAITIAMLSGTYFFLGYKTYDFAREHQEVAVKEKEIGRASCRERV